MTRLCTIHGHDDRRYRILISHDTTGSRVRGILERLGDEGWHELERVSDREWTQSDFITYLIDRLQRVYRVKILQFHVGLAVGPIVADTEREARRKLADRWDIIDDRLGEDAEPVDPEIDLTDATVKSQDELEDERDT